VKRIPLSDGTFTIVDDADYEIVCNLPWHRRKSRGKSYVGMWSSCRMIFLHRMIMCAGKDVEVDHIDGDGLNNTRGNLRLCSHADNIHNSKKIARRNLTSTYKGVSWSQCGRNWKAQIWVGGKNVYLGVFALEIEAAAARDRAARALHGDFVKLNLV
jgi:hypothetical protein